MGKRKERLSEGKKNIIADLIREYDIQSAEDIQDALKDLLGGTLESMLQAEMDQHLGYDEYERSDNTNSRNGLKSKKVRKVIYTTNAIESLNSTYRRLNRQRSVFPNNTALLKALYLATFEATKKWTMPLRNWGKVYGELSIMYEGRL